MWHNTSERCAKSYHCWDHFWIFRASILRRSPCLRHRYFNYNSSNSNHHRQSVIALDKTLEFLFHKWSWIHHLLLCNHLIVHSWLTYPQLHRTPFQIWLLLGTSVKCSSESCLTSEINCSISNRIVAIAGITSYEPCFENLIIIKLQEYYIHLLTYFS